MLVVCCQPDSGSLALDASHGCPSLTHCGVSVLGALGWSQSTVLWVWCSVGPNLKWCPTKGPYSDWRNLSPAIVEHSIHCSVPLLCFSLESSGITTFTVSLYIWSSFLVQNQELRRKYRLLVLFSALFSVGFNFLFWSFLGSRSPPPSAFSSPNCYFPVPGFLILERLLCCCLPLCYLPGSSKFVLLELFDEKVSVSCL